MGSSRNTGSGGGEEKLYPDPGTPVVIRTHRHGFEHLDGREAEVVSWDGYRGTIILRVPATPGEKARGEFGRRVEVARDEVETKESPFEASDEGVLHSAFASTTGGVMTEEVGAVTGELELLTRPALEGRAVEALVRYVGAGEEYRVSGSPTPTGGEDHRRVHEAILARLTTPPGPIGPGGNERPADLRVV